MESLQAYPAVALVGPRQSGKTTLAKALGAEYFDLEQPEQRLRLDIQWNNILSQSALIILDEAQNAPEFFPKLRAAIDEDRKRNGRFLLLGSISPALMRQVGESLAGRMAVLELAPLLGPELEERLGELLWQIGGYPDGGILGMASGYPGWHENYLRLMVERDLPNWGLPSKPAQSMRLLQILAATNGTVQNASSLGQALGVSYHTVQAYLDYLEGVFLIRRLQPWQANIRKRLVKSPKIYWRDTGLLHSLLKWDARDDFLAQPWIGTSWESHLVEQILGTFRSLGIVHEAGYFRSHDGLECDLVVRSEGMLELFEFKLGASPDRRDMERLGTVRQLLKGSREILLCRTSDAVVSEDRWVTNIADYLRRRFPALQPPVGIEPSAAGLDYPRVLDWLRQAFQPLVQYGVTRDAALQRRARWLEEDIPHLLPELSRSFHVRRLRIPGTELMASFIFYPIPRNDRSVENAQNPFQQNTSVNAMEGAGLTEGSLAGLAIVDEIARTRIPHAWPPQGKWKQRFMNLGEHLDALNEVWWLGRWPYLDAHSIEKDARLLPDHQTGKNVDWRFTCLNGLVAINLEVKRREGSYAAHLHNKQLRLFGMEKDVWEQFGRPSRENELNVLAVTAFHPDALAADEDRHGIGSLLAGESRGCIDAVFVWVPHSREGTGGNIRRVIAPHVLGTPKEAYIMTLCSAEPTEEERLADGFSAQLVTQSIPGVLKSLGIEPPNHKPHEKTSGEKHEE